MQGIPKANHSVLPAIFLGLIALLLYTGTLSFYPFPGESAAFLVRHSGLDPAPPAYHPVWALLADGIAHLQVSTLAFRLGLLSALCGAGCVALQFLLSSRTSRPGLNLALTPGVNWIAGLSAALYLMLSTPFWASANRAHSICFHLLWLMVAVFLFRTHLLTRRPWPAWAATFLLGLGFLEWSLFPIVVPVMLLVLLVIRLAQPDPERLPLFPVAGWFLAGFALFVTLFWFRLQSVTPSLAMPLSYLPLALLSLLGEHVSILRSAYGGIAGILITLGGVLPWLMILASARQERVPTRPLGSGFLLLVLSGLTVFLFGLGTFSPDLLLDLHSLASVPPFLLLATCYGHVMGEWYLRILLPPEQSPGLQAARFRLLLPGLGALLLLSALNFPKVETGAAAVASLWAMDVARSLPNDTVLVAHGSVHNQLLLAMSETRTPSSPRAINLARNRDPDYRVLVGRYLAAPPQTPPPPEDLKPWLAHAPAEALLGPPRICSQIVLPPWRQEPLVWLPSLGLYHAHPPSTALPANSVAKHTRFWDLHMPAIRTRAAQPGFTGRFFSHILAESSRLANDLGILCLEQRRFEDADIALARAREFLPGNPSAAYNRFLLLSHLGRRTQIDHAWEGALAMIQHGNPAAVESLYGQLWSAVGLPTLHRALTEETAIPTNALPFQAAVAGLLTGNTDITAARTQIEQTPDNPAAWHVYGLTAMYQEPLELAAIQETLGALDRIQADPIPLLLAAADRAQRQALPGQARSWLEDAVNRKPADLTVLEAIVAYNRTAASPLPASYLNRLVSLDPQNPLAEEARELAQQIAARDVPPPVGPVKPSVEPPPATTEVARAEAPAPPPAPPPVAPPAIATTVAQVDPPPAEPASPRVEIAVRTAPPPQPEPTAPGTMQALLNTVTQPSPAKPPTAIAPTAVPSAPRNEKATFVLETPIPAPAELPKPPPLTPVRSAPPLDLDDEEAPVPLAW